jgi:hypothetical protein
MRWLILRGLLVLLAALATSVARAATEEQARELHTLSGFESYIRSYPEHMRQGVQNAPQELPAPVQEAMRRALDRPANLEPLHDTARQLLRERISDAHAEAVLAWLRSELGRRVALLEEERGVLDAREAIRAYVTSLEERPPSRRRLELLQRLMQAVGVEQFAEQAWLASAVAVALAVNAAQPQSNRLPAERIRKLVQSQVAGLRQSLMEGVLITMLFVYDPLDDDELALYADFNETEAGRAYNAAVTRAMIDTLGRYSYRFGEVLADEVRRMLEQRQG